MKHLKRILLLLVLIIAVGAGVLFVLIRFLPETELIRDAVTEKLRDLTGQEITMESMRVSGSFPEMISLTVEGVKATSKTGERIGSIDRLVLTPSLTRLLEKELFIKSIVIEGLQTTLTRAADGNLQYPFLVLPVSAPGSREEQVRQHPTSDIRVKSDVSKEEQPKRTEPARGLKWSIESVKLIKGRVDFIDRYVVPGRETRFIFTDLNASLNQEARTRAFEVRMNGRFGPQDRQGNAVTLTGLIHMADDLSRAEQASLSFLADRVDLDPFRVYLPQMAAVGEKLSLTKSHCELTVKHGEAGRFSFDTILAIESGAVAEVKLRGDGVVAEDFSGVQRVRFAAQTQQFPLSVLSARVPTSMPLDLAKGVAEATVEGEWEMGGQLKLRGTVDCKDVNTSGILQKISPQIRLRSQFDWGPESLNLETVEISEAVPIASLSGKIMNPLSAAPELNLKGNLSVRTAWIKGLGVGFVKSVDLDGDIPIQAHLQGTPAELLVNLVGDLTGIAVDWKPYLKKARGEKGTCSAQGKIVQKEGRAAAATSELRLAVELDKPKIRIGKDKPWITEKALHFGSRLLIAGKAMELRNALLSLKKSGSTETVLTANANVVNLSSSNPTFHGNGAASLNRNVLKEAGIPVPEGLSLTGGTQMKVGFNGTPSAFSWSLDCPLSPLGLEVDNAFRKPVKVPGDLRAAGKWAKQRLHLDSGRLSFPGVEATANGVLLDEAGKFGGVRVHVKRTNLKDLGKLIPQLAAAKVSGPAEADIRLNPSEGTVAPDGTIRLFGVEYRPTGAGWRVTQLRGTLKTDGNALTSDDITGTLDGEVHAPLKVKASLNNIKSVESMNGRVSLQVGKGRMKADQVRKILQPAQVLAGTLLGIQGLNKMADFLQFDSITGDVAIQSGTARTSNLQVKGPDLSAGVIGNVRLKDAHLDLLAGVHTVMVTTDALGKIPAVQQTVKKYEGLLKITGLDKELKRLGITVPDKNGKQSEAPRIIKTPVTVILKVQGSSSSPEVTPVLETSLDKRTAGQLKSLMDNNPGR